MADITVLPKVMALQLVGVMDAGSPNQERVYLKANLDVRLGEYLLLTGWKITQDIANPLPENVLWLGHLNADAGMWVVVYTGPGEQRITQMDTGEPGLILHWGKQTTIFHHPQVVPVLVHLDAVGVGSHL
jgi:hypothetical protein